jgi:hypothetical protein
VRQQFGPICGNFNFQISSYCLHPLPEFPSGVVGALGVSNNQDIADFMRQMIESMKALKKQSEDLNTRLTAAEGCNG